MAPTAPILRIGSSLSSTSTASPTASTTRATLPDKPAGPPPPPFDRASAFKERLQATKERAAAGLPNRPSALSSSAPPPRAPPPRPPVQQPVAAPRPPVAQPSPYSDPQLVYPIGGPRTTSAPPAPSASSSSYAPTSPPPPVHGAYGYPQHYQPQHPYSHHMPSTATPFYLPSHPHPHPHPHPDQLGYPSPFANPYLAYPPAPPSSSPAYPPPSTAHDTQTWPAPEIEWRRAPAPAPPVPAGLTSDGRATDYGAAAAASSEEQGAMSAAVQEQEQARKEQESTSPRARRRSATTTVPRPVGGFVSAFEDEFGGAERAREGALGLCGLEEGLGAQESEGERLEGELLRVWRDKVAPLSHADLDDAAHDLLDGLHYLLLTSPSLPSLPSALPELSSLELALLDVAIRAEGLDVAGERAAVRERWQGVERKWTARTTRVLKLEDRQAGLVAALVEKVAELELEGEQAQARTRRLEASVAAAKGEVEQLKERAERAEAKLEAKPSQRVGILLEDLKKVTATRDALSTELDDARSALAAAQIDPSRLRRPSPAFLPSTSRASLVLNRIAGPLAGQDTPSTDHDPDHDHDRTHVTLLAAELRRARETHDADRMIADERVRALRAEAAELRRALARRASTAAATAGPGTGTGGGAAAAGQAGASLVGAAIERELEGARAELTKKGFVVTRLAEKVKELNRELEGKARENADLLDRLAGAAPRASSASTPASP
ncbi:hypothetical protein JCM8208_007364 [Rhodotorula glutinis]